MEEKKTYCQECPELLTLYYVSINFAFFTDGCEATNEKEKR